MITWRWIDTITTQLELSEARAGETAVLLSTDTTDPQLRQAAFHALERLGCTAVSLMVSATARVEHDAFDNEVTMACATEADLIIDLADLVAQSPHHTRLLAAARILTVDVATAAEIEDLVAHPGLPRRVERLDDLLADGAMLEVSSGTATLEASLEANRRRAFRGVADRANTHERWPAGIVWVRPHTEGVNGEIVLMPGDAIVEARHLVRTPVRLDVEAGHLVEIHGDSTDADAIRTLLEEQAGSDATYCIAEIGIGLNQVRTAAAGVFDPAKLGVGRGALSAGSCTLSFGPASHPAATLTINRATVSVDNLILVDDGNLTGALAPDVYEIAARGV